MSSFQQEKQPPLQNETWEKIWKFESKFQQNLQVICVHTEFGKHWFRWLVSTMEPNLAQQKQTLMKSG